MPPKKTTQSKKSPVETVETKSTIDNKVTVLDCDSDENLEDKLDDKEEEEEEEEEEEDDEEEGEVKVADTKKTKKPKETVEELFVKSDLNESRTKEVVLKIAELEKELQTLNRERSSLLKLFKKAHADEISLATKTKPKRKGNVMGGFNAPAKVPPVLIKYLKLEDDAELSRPQVAKLLHQKFKDAGLKDGAQTTLDEKTVKELKLPKSFVGKVIKIIAKEENDITFQTFLKDFYPKKEVKPLQLQ